MVELLLAVPGIDVNKGVRRFISDCQTSQANEKKEGECVLAPMFYSVFTMSVYKIESEFEFIAF